MAKPAPAPATGPAAAGASAWLRETAAVLEAAAAAGLDGPVAAAAAALVEAFGARRMVLICGNGGSAADAMHIAGETVGRFRRERPGLKAVALGADAAVISAWSNDYDYESAFARQVEALGEAGGVVWGISTSGNSENVVRALLQGRAMAMTTLAMTGEGGGRLAAAADILIAVPSRDTPRVQEVHRCLYHHICERVDERLAAGRFAAPSAAAETPDGPAAAQAPPVQ